MDIIEDTVRRLKHYCEIDSRKLKEKLSEEFINFYRLTDRIKIIESLLKVAKEQAIQHSKVCNGPKNCGTTENLALSEFYLVQELEILGINTGQEIIDLPEQTNLNEKLDKVLQEIEILKLGNEIIYDDLKAEIEELKELYFLSKKNWKQILYGKVMDMTLSGIISEEISKKILSIVKEDIIKFLAN